MRHVSRFPFLVPRSIFGAEPSAETPWVSAHNHPHRPSQRAFSATCWTSLTCCTSRTRFSRASRSAPAYSCVTYLLFASVGIVVLTVRGKAAITGFADLRAPLGLDLLAPNVGLYLGTVLNGINPFAIWGVWLTGTGISITHGTSRGTAIFVTAFVYLIALLIIATPTLLLGLATRQ